ncbi:hypothetical protein STRDD12_01024 [Streptococcus sp. DD12]|nr:hypothetical protein STRDD12_01024 [Streptococcus sp. DD12]
MFDAVLQEVQASFFVGKTRKKSFFPEPLRIEEVKRLEGL